MRYRTSVLFVPPWYVTAVRLGVYMNVFVRSPMIMLIVWHFIECMYKYTRTLNTIPVLACGCAIVFRVYLRCRF